MTDPVKHLEGDVREELTQAIGPVPRENRVEFLPEDGRGDADSIRRPGRDLGDIGGVRAGRRVIPPDRRYEGAGRRIDIHEVIEVSTVDLVVWPRPV